MRRGSAGASSASASPARSRECSGGMGGFYTQSGVPRRAAGPEEVGPAALRERFGQRRGERREGRCRVGGGARRMRGGGASELRCEGTLRSLPSGDGRRNAATHRLRGGGSRTGGAGGWGG